MSDDLHANRNSPPSPLRLLGEADPPAVIVQNPGGATPYLLVCDHAGRQVPRRLGGLGLPEAEFERHVAYDLGAAELASRLAERLDATLIRQRYSRLVIDCNRNPSRADSIVTFADGAEVPGNIGLSEDEREARIAEIHRPYHAAIAAELDRRAALHLKSALVLVHSFTPVLSEGRPRPWHVGVLHLGNPLSLAMLELLRREGDLVVGDNQPYAMDVVDFTAPFHAGRRELEYVELEVRQDLIADAAGQDRFADRFARLLPQARAMVGTGDRERQR